MKRQNDNPDPKTFSPGAIVSVVFLSLSLATHMSAQSAEIFIAKTQDSVNDGEQEAAQEPVPEPVDDKPSRFAGSEISSYIASRAAAFSMKGRTTDPFGLNQDPSVKPVIKKIASKLPAQRQAALPPTPLSDIVKLIRVTTIIPGEKRFLVGVREFAESEEFPLLFRGKKMRMKILEVSARSILFKNLDNGETASLVTEMLPPGMIAGGDKIQPPGLVSPLDDMPLELGSDRELNANN